MSRENPTVWLGMVPTKIRIKKTNELITDTPWQISRKEIQKINRKKRVLGEKVSQAESQKVKQISIILATIDKFGPINTSEIRELSGLSWNCVIRTLKLLCKKKTVKQKQTKHKVNNEKIYSLHRENAIIYHENLLFHKMQTFEKMPKKKVKNFLEKWKFVKERLPKGWEEWQVDTKMGKKRISELHEMKLLMFNFIIGMYCKDCFKEGVVKKWKQKNGISFCSNCYREDTYEDHFFRKKSNTNYRKWEVDKDISKIEEKYEKLEKLNV